MCLPSWPNIWSCELDISASFVPSALPQNCFAKTLSNIHVNNNAVMSNNNTCKIYKLRPMINRLNSNFARLYNVSHNVSVDESMVLFKGRNSLKQYKPIKPIKGVFKLWPFPYLNGYLYHCKVYRERNQLFVDNSMPKYLA